MPIPPKTILSLGATAPARWPSTRLGNDQGRDRALEDLASGSHRCPQMRIIASDLRNIWIGPGSFMPPTFRPVCRLRQQVDALGRNKLWPACGLSDFAGHPVGKGMAGTTGLEPATSDVTGRRSNQLNYVPANMSRRYSNANTAGTRSPNHGAAKSSRALLMWRHEDS